VTYSCLRLPETVRPASYRLFRWQDQGFDGAIARALPGDPGQWLHALPGQALETFGAARRQGIGTVLNHASGPVRQQLALVEEEYRRAAVEPDCHHGYDAAYFMREEAEYALADRHCAASSIVRKQLIAAGVVPEKIWVVPYGADPDRFHPPTARQTRDPCLVVYAGQLTLRKGLRLAFAALTKVRRSLPITFDLYGPVNPDIRSTLAKVACEPWIVLRGPVSQSALADVFRQASVLVLPSWEEAFGLVIVQALNCGLPCVVSDRVGAADLIEHRRNGSIFPAGNSGALAEEIAWWLQNPPASSFLPLTWDGPAQHLIELSQSV